jgi:NitT/TauT family transport system permease protein
MKKSLIYISIILVLIILWQYCGQKSGTVRLLISTPVEISNYILENIIDLLYATFTTFIESVIGLLLAVLISFLLMIIVFYRPSLMDYLLPLMVMSQVIPLIVLAPFFILLLGIGISSKVAMAALMCFFPIFINFARGFQSISNNILDLVTLYRAKTSFRIIHIYFPLSVPNIMTGLKISAPLAIIGAIVAEFTGAKIGLGKNLFLSSIRLDPELMFSSLILSACLGGVIFGTILIIESRIGKWYSRNE